MSWGVANGVYLLRYVPDILNRERYWLFLVTLLTATITLALIITFGELDSAAKGKPFSFDRRAILSPTKLYHNIALYGAYGFIGSAAYITDIVGGVGWRVLLWALPLFGWLVLLFSEGHCTARTRLQKAESAHRRNWRPIWSPRK